MYHLKLIKGLSYCGIIEATKKKPDVFIEDKAIADTAVATGYFKLIEGTEKMLESKEAPFIQTKYFNEIELTEMKFDDLKQLAAEIGIDTKGFKSKADYIKAIATVKDITNSELDKEDNEVNYGEESFTMIDLQKQ